MRAVTVIHETDSIRRLPQRDQRPVRKLTAYNTITPVVSVAPAAEKIVEAVVLLQDDDDVSDRAHRRRSGRVRPGGSSSRQHLREQRDEQRNPDQSPGSQPTGARTTPEG